VTLLTPHSSLLTGKAAHRAVFLDRDGTVNIEKHYLFRPEEFELFPGVPESIRRLNQAGFLVIVVTNQSGVARGYFSLTDVEDLHRHLQAELALYGAHVDAFYVCPHHPDHGQGEFRIDCDCRKGAPGMLLQAAKEYAIDMPRSFMVGDKPADIEAGLAAGCTPLLVLTGYGQASSPKVANQVLRFADLPAAVDYIMSPELKN
jgi:D-glycero-D-manno-heptose 1,7-bisphosphate phosphatase